MQQQVVDAQQRLLQIQQDKLEEQQEQLAWLQAKLEQQEERLQPVQETRETQAMGARTTAVLNQFRVLKLRHGTEADQASKLASRLQLTAVAATLEAERGVAGSIAGAGAAGTAGTAWADVGVDGDGKASVNGDVLLLQLWGTRITGHVRSMCAVVEQVEGLLGEGFGSTQGGAESQSMEDAGR